MKRAEAGFTLVEVLIAVMVLGVGITAMVGSRVQDIPGSAGDRLVYDIVSQADREPGWVEYDITNPATGAVQTKMSYVSRAGDLYVGCGVYKALAAR